MIEYIKGNLFDDLRDNDCIIHVCNDVGVWLQGFVVPLGNRFPCTKEGYFSWFNFSDHENTDEGWCTSKLLSLGHIQVITHLDGFGVDSRDIWCVNMIAQSAVVSKTSLRPLNYESLYQCLEYVRDNVPNTRRIVGPKFGAGLAGGNWNIISAMIEQVLNDREVVIYTLD